MYILRPIYIYVYLNTSGPMTHWICVSLLIFCLDDAPIAMSGVLKSSTIMVFVCIRLFMFGINRFICVGVSLWGHKHLQLLAPLDG